ncbi:FAD-dependent monooxygenase [Thalassomonas sp. RHCl1]|uniref:FAD-dependent monooxygenase n=1 Tax=Thalassomonas sp. RHCl1 TaxID=2995320 RepID=UPI00248C70FC|nr:FAD-dependent monooxygenase [Thalassomonas sp. RHCl1]
MLQEIEQEVLIVGGGPTGMITALQLHRFGIPFRIIEVRTEKCSGSKALSVNPAALDMLADLGITESLLPQGQKNQIVNLMYNDKRMFKLDFNRISATHPYFLMLPQPVTEAAIENRLNELGYEIERGTELVSLEQNEHGAQATCKGVNGEDTRQYRYIVGCDGANSKTRQQVGLPFDGYNYDLHFILADVKVKWDRDLTQSYYYIKEQGFIIVLPLMEGYHRIVIKADGKIPDNYQPGLEDFQAAIAALDVDIEISEPTWMSAAPFYNRATSTFRRGNVFVAGDAAHLFSPIGGFGMNTGIGDAFNLGWKLGYVMSGAGSDALLDSYAQERHWNAEQLLKLTDLNTSMIAGLDRHGEQDEAKFLPKVANRDFIKAFPQISAGYKLNYAKQAPDPQEKYHVGGLLLSSQFLPFANEFPLGNGKHSLIVSSEIPAEQLAELEGIMQSAFGDFFRINTIWDPQAYMLDAGQFILVRPDNVIEYVGTTKDSAAFNCALNALYQKMDVAA